MVTGLSSVSGQTEKLHIGEACFKCEGQHDRDRHGIAGHHHVVEERPRSDCGPFIRMHGFVCPIPFSAPLDIGIRKVELDLPMSVLIHHSESRHIPVARCFSESRHAGFTSTCSVFCKCDRSEVKLHGANPAWIGPINETITFQCRFD